MATAALPAELTIDNVATLRLVWRDWLHAEAAALHADIDASGVDTIDSAGVQLLVSLVRAQRELGGDVRLLAPSAALRDACDAMGTTAWMKIVPAAAVDDPIE